MFIIKKILKFFIPEFYLRFALRLIYDPKKRGINELLIQKKFKVKYKNKNLFTLRDFGGSTAARGRSLFTKEVDTINWINSFDQASNFIDVGANIGIFSLYAASRGHNVLSFEPESLNFCLLNLNINDNSFNDKIIAYPISIHNKENLGILEVPNLQWGKSNNQFSDSAKNEDINNSFKQGSIGIPLDESINAIGYIPDYIKIDVDGNEIFVLKSMQDLIKKQTFKSILVEIDENINESLEIKKLLDQGSYKLISKNEIITNSNVYNYIFSSK